MDALQALNIRVFRAPLCLQNSLASLTAMLCLFSFAGAFVNAFLWQTPALADAPSALTKKVAGQYEARVVMIYDHECAVWCGQVKPILAELQSEYKAKVQFVALDTSSDQISSSKITAKAIGASKFLSENADYAPVIGVFSAKGKLLKELVGPKKKEIYADAIAKALSTQ
ncbi:MAG: hypothetical protein C0508_18995 [Cyanobacteria bacterium PR.023]|jgi:hypothetical protein|nr:hypothetical protein [Cyanobacteria bacterium PR.023]MDQ5933537.1 Thioredoxin protein [Cyanobacteriota bacterium erpe_2018_sw_21hr_WHONDRS-SW48-000092_B_bin.40]